MKHFTKVLKTHSQSSDCMQTGRTNGHKAGADEKVSIVKDTKVMLYDHTCSPLWSVMVVGLKDSCGTENVKYMKHNSLNQVSRYSVQTKTWLGTYVV